MSPQLEFNGIRLYSGAIRINLDATRGRMTDGIWSKIRHYLLPFFREADAEEMPKNRVREGDSPTPAPGIVSNCSNDKNNWNV